MTFVDRISEHSRASDLAANGYRPSSHVLDYADLHRSAFPKPKAFAMYWYQYLACFFTGAFLANFVPHFVKGICGDKFPTPFAKPPGKGLSSPLVNVLWALFNLVIAYVLYRGAKVSSSDCLSIGIFFVGFALMSIMGAKNFAN